MSANIINNRDKFSMVVMPRLSCQFHENAVLSDGTKVFSKFPVNIDDSWKRWLGELQIEKLESSNLIFLINAQSERPEILDGEHEALKRHLNQFYFMLPFYARISCIGATLMTGSVVNDEVQIRSIAELEDYYIPRECEEQLVTLQDLEFIANSNLILSTLNSSRSYQRFIRGIRAYVNACGQKYGADRLHGYVRALEALILPNIGRTRNEFAQRCATFSSRSKANNNILLEIYDMRCDIEHMHDWYRALSYLPDDERNSVALLRTRQSYELACYAYKQVFQKEELREFFVNEESIERFWKLPEEERYNYFTPGFNLEELEKDT